jgi:hypothetical protein
MIALKVQSIQKEYGWKSGLRTDDGKITFWPYDVPQPTEEDLLGLVEKWGPVIQWEQDMVESDLLMTRREESHFTHMHAGVTGDPYTQVIYDAKVALRASKPQI